jgi:uncharacterized membrane protein (DUF485 family)
MRGPTRVRLPAARHRREWSKTLTVLVLIPYLAALWEACAFVPALFSREAYSDSVTLMLGILGAAAAPVAVVYGFYFWKAKAENLVKLARQMKQEGVCDDVAGRVVDTDEIGG